MPKAEAAAHFQNLFALQLSFAYEIMGLERYAAGAHQNSGGH